MAQAPEPLGEALTPLGNARPASTDAYWFWARDPNDHLPDAAFTKGMVGGTTFRLSFAKGLHAELRAAYETERQAKFAANGWRGLPGIGMAFVPAGPMKDFASELMRGYAAQHEGQTVVVSLRQPDFEMNAFVDELLEVLLTEDAR